MKKFIIFIIIIVVIGTIFIGVTDNNDTTDLSTTIENNTTLEANNDILLFDEENVKISFCGTNPDIGNGAGIVLLVENTRDESVVVTVTEVSLNGEMCTVIQPQMPTHLTSPEMQSKQIFSYPGITKLEGVTQFKITVMDENFNSIITSDYIDITLP